VVFSVIAELVIAFIEPPYDIFLKLSAPTDAAVAIGIVGEVLFGMWDGRIQTELRKRSNDKLGVAVKSASEANERAAKLEKEAADARGRVAEIERLHGWRRISAEQGVQIADAIRGQAEIIDVLIEHERGDREAYSYASELAGVFANAGVRPENIRGTPNSYFGVVWNLSGKA
jgi:hypothetical protein